jgi:hypothetical protein
MAGREREVKVTVLGEDRGASKALKQVDDAAGRLGPSGKIANNALDGITSRLTGGLGPASGEAKAALDKVGGSALESGGLLKTALAGGALVAGAALAKFAFDGAMQFVSLAAEIRTFQRASGASAEESSRFVAVLDDLGIASDKGANAIFKLAKTAATGADGLKAVGIEVARNRDGTTNLTETLLNAADAYSSTTDPAKRAEIAFAAFGKQGKDLIPVLEQGRAGLQKFFEGAEKGHQIFSQKDLDQARQYELAMDDLQDAMRGLQLRAGPGVVGIITEISQALADGLTWIDEHSQKGSTLEKVWVLMSAAVKDRFVPALLQSGKANKESGDEAAQAAVKFEDQAATLKMAGYEVSELEEETGQLTETNKKALAAAEKYKAMIDTMATSISYAYNVTGRQANELTEEHRKLARGFDEAKGAANQLKQGLDILVGVKISATRAAISWEEKLRSTSATLRENKATLDITTEAGRTNTTAILDMVQAGFAHVEALQREGASSAQVSAAYGDHVAALRRVMHQAGYTDSQINDLLYRYNLMAAAPNIEKSITTYHNEYHRQYYETIRGQAPWVGSMHTGGIVPGSGDVPMLLEGGEGVFTPEQMAVLGASMGRGGDGASAGTIVVVNVAGSVVTERELVEAVQSGLLQKQRRVPTLGLS